jgi:integrase
MGETSTKLIKRTVDNAVPREVRYFVWDSELKGFALRVAPTGTKTYIVRYRPRGLGAKAPKRFVVLGRHGPLTPDEARARARALLGAVAAGQDPAKAPPPAPEAMTVAGLIDLFLDEHVRAKRKSGTASGYAIALNNYVRVHFGQKSVFDLSASDLGRLHHLSRDRPYQANRMLAVVASMYGFAAKRELVPRGTNPAEGIERYRESSRERYLSMEELSRLGETLRLAETTGLPWRTAADKPASKHLPSAERQTTLLSPEVVLAFRLLLLTGARLREILHLEWRHVDLERGLLLLPDSKTGRKTIVLSSLVVGLLRDAARQGEYVIPGASAEHPRSDLKKPWLAIQRHAGLQGVRLHDLRHTFASVGAGASLGLPVVGKLLGHSQPATTARYAHLDADPLRRATNVIGEALQFALERPKIVRN